MAKQAVYDYSTTPASNTDIDGVDSTGTTGLVKSGDNYARSMMAHAKGFALDLGSVNTVAGTADAITVTLSSAPSALVDGMRITINASAANTGATTLNVTPAGGAAFGAKKVMKWSAGSEAELSAGDIPAANALVELIYDSARNAASGAWMLLGSSIAAATTTSSGTVELLTDVEFFLGSDTTRAPTASNFAKIAANQDVLAHEVADLKAAVMYLADGIADPFDSESGVDTATSTNESYDSGNDYYGPTSTAEAAISGGTGTNIGDMTTNGGLAAIFDGTTSQADTACGRATAVNNAYAGKNYSSSPKKISKVICYGGNNVGFWHTYNSTATLDLYGKNGGAPSNDTDGTLLGTLSYTDTTNESAGRTVTSTDTLTAWDYVWVRTSQPGAAANAYMAELTFYEAGTPNNMTLASNAYTASAVPTAARVSVFADPQQSVTLNTDVTAEVSRDGGTTYSAVTLALVSNPVGTVEQYSGTVDISGQPSGSSMKWRLKNLNNKLIYFTGIVLRWR